MSLSLREGENRAGRAWRGARVFFFETATKVFNSQPFKTGEHGVAEVSVLAKQQLLALY